MMLVMTVMMMLMMMMTGDGVGCDSYGHEEALFLMIEPTYDGYDDDSDGDGDGVGVS